MKGVACYSPLKDSCCEGFLKQNNIEVLLDDCLQHLMFFGSEALHIPLKDLEPGGDSGWGVVTFATLHHGDVCSVGGGSTRLNPLFLRGGAP